MKKLLTSKYRIILVLFGVSVFGWLAIQPIVSATSSFYFYLMFWVSLALTLNFLFGFTGYVPFGFFGFYGVGAYGTALTYIHFGVPMSFSIFVGAASGLCLALLFYPMLRLDGIYFAIANFAGAYAIGIAIGLTPRDITGGAIGLELAAAYDPVLSYYAMFGVTIAVVLITIWLSHSRVGIMLKAIRDDEVAAQTSGINVTRVRNYAWWLCAGFAGIIGGIDAWNTAVIDPDSAFDIMISVEPFLHTIFGGPATLIGPILGASSLYMIDDWIWQTFPSLSYLLTGLMLMIVVLILPRGIVGEIEHRGGLKSIGEDTYEYVSDKKDVLINQGEH